MYILFQRSTFSVYRGTLLIFVVMFLLVKKVKIFRLVEGNFLRCLFNGRRRCPSLLLSDTLGGVRFRDCSCHYDSKPIETWG